MSNSSSISLFFLLAFADRRELQLLHFWLFLGIYLTALLGNGLIISTLACDHHLHTPYTSSSSTSPSSIWDPSPPLCPKPWPIPSGTTQTSPTRDVLHSSSSSLSLSFFMIGELYLLTIMPYNRYVAICKSLHYGTPLGSRACVHMAAAAWGTAFLTALLYTANTFSLPLCQGNALDQFVCEPPEILKLSCSHSYLREFWVILTGSFLLFSCFVFIVVSYVEIFRAVLRIPSEQGRLRAFSMCLPHLAVFSLFLSTAMVSYLMPRPIPGPVVSFLYSVVPPAVNPPHLKHEETRAQGCIFKSDH